MPANQKRSGAERQKKEEKSHSRSVTKYEARVQKRQEEQQPGEKGSTTGQSKSNRATKGELRLEPGQSAKTIDHQVIRYWIEERGGKPATVKATEGNNDPGLLRVDFPENGETNRLEEISWESFFEKFEEKQLAFLYQEETYTGQVSHFSKFVSRGSDDKQ